MKLKYSILASLLAVSISLLPQATLALESPDKGAPGVEEFTITMSASEVAETAAEDIATEQVILSEDTLIDFTVPVFVDGEKITKIGEGCFKGCDVIKSVTIPAAITEIGADAFADCPYLEVIYFEGRADAADLILGENWNGEAEVVYLLADVAEDAQDPAADIPAAAPSEEAAPVTPDASEPSEDANNQEEAKDEQSQGAEGDLPADEAQPSDEPAEPTDGSQAPADPPSDAPVVEEPAVSDDAAAGEGTPPSGDQPSDASEGAVTEPATDPAAEPAATEIAE